MSRLIAVAIRLAVLSVLLCGLPLAGAALAGQPLMRYLEFPPLTRHVVHAPWSAVAFAVFAALTFVLLLGFLALVLPAPATRASAARRPLPWWGWVAAGTLALTWGLAWTRLPWFAPLQPYTFTPLWLSVIVLVNALTWRRSGRCLLTAQPRFLAWLFPVSAVFWWYFEFLNRFVENWYYLGVETFSPAHYALHASCAFSTVLPAVTSVTEYLGLFAALREPRFRGRLAVTAPRRVAACLLAAAAAGLVVVPAWSDYLFPLLWVAPLVVFVCLQVLAGEQTAFAPLRTGDWSVVVLPACAALVCGFFWELWNFHSLAKWIYSIPLVHRYPIFEMPILGYAGYPSFGLECFAVAGWVAGWVEANPVRRLPCASEPASTDRPGASTRYGAD